VGAASSLQQFELRPLSGADAPAYFDRRNHILEIGEGHFFSDSYEREGKLVTEQLRRDWCTEKHDHCILGAFADRNLVGFVMITQYGPPADQTVEWEAAWVDPRYRGTGLTKALYEEVEQWTVSEGYRFVKSFIREDNKRWLDIRRRTGFVEIGTKYVSHWADNTGGNMVILERDLLAPKPQQQKALHFLEDTISSLESLHAVPNSVVRARKTYALGLNI
jgi:GNAT superfamily N-acetyltransferase